MKIKNLIKYITNIAEDKFKINENNHQNDIISVYICFNPLINLWDVCLMRPSIKSLEKTFSADDCYNKSFMNYGYETHFVTNESSLKYALNNLLCKLESANFYYNKEYKRYLPETETIV